MKICMMKGPHKIRKLIIMSRMAANRSDALSELTEQCAAPIHEQSFVSARV